MLCKTKNLSIDFNNVKILNDISTNIKFGKTTAIVGKNGSGKSTLLKCINCLIKPSSGFIEHMFNHPFPMLFQRPIILHNTIKYNFEVVCKIKKIRPTMNWYYSFQLDKISSKKIHQTSGGEQQKTFLSRIMSTDPEVIFMDEPDQNLDSLSEEIYVKLMNEERKKKKTIVITSHNIEMIKRIADEIILLDYGKLIYSGPLKSFLIRENTSNE